MTHPPMIVIICAKYKKNPSRTVDATEQIRFSKSRLSDLEDIGQGQGSSDAKHPLMLICTKYGKNPSWTVDATGQTRKVNGQTDGGTDRHWIQYTPPPPHPNLRCGWYENNCETGLLHKWEIFPIFLYYRTMPFQVITVSAYFIKAGLW